MKLSEMNAVVKNMSIYTILYIINGYNAYFFLIRKNIVYIILKLQY